MERITDICFAVLMYGENRMEKSTLIDIDVSQWCADW